MVAIGRIVQRAGLVDDAYARFLRFDDDFFDVVDAILYARMQRHAGLDRGLRMKLGRIGNLEQHVFHDVAAVPPLESERLCP